MDQMQKQGKEPKAIVARIQANRARMELSGPSSSTVYKFLAGQTHNRGRSETRGRDSKMPEGLDMGLDRHGAKLDTVQVVWLRDRADVVRHLPEPVLEPADGLAQHLRAATAAGSSSTQASPPAAASSSKVSGKRKLRGAEAEG